MTSKEASEKIMQIVNVAKEGNEEAYRSFSSKRNRIERKASNSMIDLFGGTAVYEIREIVSETKEAAEEYYVSNQSLVRMLDEECKPFLVFAPYKKTVNAVSETMKKLNEDSSININLGASLNYGASNDVASVHYEPSIESKMIQKFWEQKARLMTETKEEKAEIEAEKLQEQKKQQEKEDDRDKERREYEEALKRHKDWEKEYKRIKTLRAEWRKQQCLEAKNKFEQQIEKERARKVASFSKRQEELEEKNQELKEKNKSLGFFDFSARKELKKEIEKIKALIESNSATIKELTAVDYIEKNAKIKLDKFNENLNEDDSKYVLPQEPEMPDEYYEPNDYYEGRDYFVREILQETILEILEDVSKPMSATQIKQYGCIDVDIRQVIHALTGLIFNDQVKKTEKNRRVYYYID